MPSTEMTVPRPASRKSGSHGAFPTPKRCTTSDRWSSACIDATPVCVGVSRCFSRSDVTWSGDGHHIYANGTKGLFDIDVATGAVHRIGDGTFHAQIAWAP